MGMEEEAYEIGEFSMIFIFIFGGGMARERRPFPL